MAGVRQQQRREERKAAREKRAKDEAKAKMRDEIRRLLIDKGSCVNPVANTELLEIHGCFEKGKQFQGALGGQLQQLYYVINAVFKLFPNDDILLKDYYAKMAEDPKNESIKNPSHPRELLLENFFLPWIMTAIKELKCDHLQFLISAKLDSLIQSFKLPKTPQDSIDFTKMTTEQYFAFRHAFVEERMFNDVYRANKGQRAMSLILDTICQILCNRTPKGVVSFRPDSLIPKIKLVSPPRGVEVERRVITEANGTETVIEKNTNERAIVRIMVPKRSMTLSEFNADQAKPVDDDNSDGPTSPKSQKEGDEEKKGADKDAADATPDKKAEDKEQEDERDTSQRNVSRLSRVPSGRLVEQDQDDRALIINNRINLQSPYMVFIMNQYAARAHRIDFIEQIRSKVVDFFTDKPKVFKQL